MTGRRWMIGCTILLWICSGIFPGPNLCLVWAQEEGQVDAGEETEKLLEDLQLDEIQELVDSIFGKEQVSMGEYLREILSGGQPLSRELVGELLKHAFFDSIRENRTVLFQVILLVLFGAFFGNFARAFGKNQVGEMSFYVVYLLLFALLMQVSGEISMGLQKSMSVIITLMKGITPAYFLAITAASGVTSASLFYQVILILILGIQMLIVGFVLPGINLYVLLELVNHLSREEMLSRLAELIKTLVEWALKTMLGLVVGMEVIQGLVAPVMDSLKRTVIGRTASAIPGVGNAINSVTEIVLTSAVLVRNSLGVVVLILLVLFGIAPLMEYAVTGFLYKLLAALAQPISDKRIVDSMNTLGEGAFLFFRTLCTVEVLCMLTVLLIASGDGGL